MKDDDLVLPSSCLQVLQNVVDPGLALLPAKMQSGPARVQVLAIMKQESGLRTRTQDGGGPAHGLAQFERGGVKGVLQHHSSAALAAAVCEARGIEATEDAVYAELVQDDILAAAFARLLLWTDANALPDIGDVEGAWDYYQRNWRPGKPRHDKWADSYECALTAVERFDT